MKTVEGEGAGPQITRKVGRPFFLGSKTSQAPNRPRAGFCPRHKDNVVPVGYFVTDKGATVLSFGRLGACEILDARKKGRPTFLVICGPAPSPSTVFISYGETKLNQLPPGAPWSIVLNLTEYFRPLRGIVTAVLERGTVKIELASRKGRLGHGQSLEAQTAL